MKLSEIQGERVFDVLAESAEPLGNIIADEKIKAALKSGEAVAEQAPAIVKLLCREHKDDVVKVLAAINGVTPNEYLQGVTVSKLVKDVFEFVTDKDAIDFLA